MLYMAYKVILTLSVMQVHCERYFSEMKIIKSHLQSNLMDDHLESYILLSVQKELWGSTVNDDIINKLVLTSLEYKCLLL